MNAITTNLYVEARIRCVGDVAGRIDRCQVFYQRAGKTQATVITENTASRKRVVQNFRYRFADANIFQDIQGSIVDFADINQIFAPRFSPSAIP